MIVFACFNVVCYTKTPQEMIQSNLSGFGDAQDGIPQFKFAHARVPQVPIWESCAFELLFCKDVPPAAESDLLRMMRMAPMKRFVLCKMR